eukprot:s182_g45.t1
MTLLTGKAYECVEHLEPTDYQKKDGDALIWKILDSRFPKLETVDELGEIMTEVFSLRAREGESMKQWTARASELFDRMNRKTGVSFPEEARGWILLNRAMLTNEQRAVVVSRARGDLKRESIASALRSCYPDLLVSKKGAALVEETLAVQGVPEDVTEDFNQDFDDVQQFLAEHNMPADSPENDEPFHENDVAEVLAASWKDRRQQLNQLQKSRQFKRASDIKRSFRVEVEELKKQTTCNRCGKRGHWARECKSPVAKGTSKGTANASSTPSGAALVETPPDFVEAAEEQCSMLDVLRQRRAARNEPAPASTEILLISSPGYGVLDSGCGRTIIGQETLREFIKLWKQQNVIIPEPYPEVHQFKFGNGNVETSTLSVSVPVWLAGRKGIIKAAIVSGSAPLLISRSALKTLKAALDFQHDSLRVFDDTSIPLKTNSAGQYVVDLMDRNTIQLSPCTEFNEVMITEAKVDESHVSEAPAPDDLAQDSSGDLPAAEPSAEMPQLACWIQEDSGCHMIPWLSHGGPTWSKVKRRVVIDAITKKVLASHDFDKVVNQKSTLLPLPSHSGHVFTKFFHADARVPESPALGMDASWHPNQHQCRQLESQVKACHETLSTQHSRKCLVQEVFSPPRFAKVAMDHGFFGLSYDLKNGYDLSTAADRKRVEMNLEQHPPELLVLCPPCTYEGGWFHLNSSKGDRLAYLQHAARSRSFIKWCCKLFRDQVNRGKRAVFEHPTGAKTWSYAEMQTLLRKYFSVKLHMCRYGMQLPGSDKFIRKSTRLLVSHADMQDLSLLCTGTEGHESHDVVAGSWPGVPSVSQFAGQYPHEFVMSVLRTVPAFRDAVPSEVLTVIDDTVPPAAWEHVDAVARVEEKSDEELLPIISKLHRNLGHPPNNDMVRVLRHGQASEQALRLAKDFSCDFCKSQCRPRVPLPAQPRRISEVNQQVGMDIKYLTGWKGNDKIKAMNIVDYASGFQRMIPFFEQETGVLLRQLFHDHWVTWLGPPKELVLDPARTNLGENMSAPTELQGTVIRPIAAGAHWQMGKVESHGGWFNRVLDKLITEHSPSNKEEWLQCVHHAHIKNQMLQVHGYSPHQFVFGKNPHIPEDLLSEPLNVISATASLTEEAIAKAQSMRTTARTALIQMQDDRALRVSLLARPRVTVDFQPGDLVAYWRDQKWVQGKLQVGGRWWGTAVILGKVGRNYVLLHRRQVIRCAPEQIRPATSEEKQLLGTPQAEMLGIKDMIEKGNIRSQQFLDLLPQSYPTMSPDQPVPPSDSIPPDAEMDSVRAPDAGDGSAPPPMQSAEVEPTVFDDLPPEPVPDASTPAPSLPEGSVDKSSYGPIRRRVTGKDGPLAIWRPAAMRQDDFVEVMKEVVPTLVEHAMEESSSASKRPHDEVENAEAGEPAPSRPRVDMTEVLSVVECSEIADLLYTGSHEVFMAEYLKKKMSKELHHSNNAPELQKMIDEGKMVEWDTIVNKPHAVKIHYGKKAAQIRAEHADRFIGSRFVLTRKPLEEGGPVDPNDWSTFRVKGRWCLQGHLDPDLTEKAEQGMLKSPTLSQLGRMTLMQVISSKKWKLQLGDIRGAFLEAGPIDQRFRPLYAHQPAGGIPGLPADAVIEICGNIYGQNDAPAAWFREFASFVTGKGWQQSALDQCLFTLRDPVSPNKLIAAMGVHVDDTALGGDESNPLFLEALHALKERFPYRKWRISSGEFCGAWYSQAEDMSIHMSMESFASNIRPVNIPKGVDSDSLLNTSQIKVLRAVNGSMNWLASQSRPDLSVQVSLSQQSFPSPKIKDLRMINHAVRHAKQESSLGITFQPIDPEKLTLVCHSDSAWANVGTHTQAGFVIGFTHADLQNGIESDWTPACWRSYKMPRAVSSTLAAESQAMSTATGTVEWLALLLSEILDGPLDVKLCRERLQNRKPILITDCKSLYDHLHSPSSPTSIEDRRTSIDVVIIRESVRLLQAYVRWVPTNRKLADGFTKDSGGPIDLLRACIKRSKYQISPENTVLEYQALERDRRLHERAWKGNPSN